MNAPASIAHQEAAFLARLGDRVRAWRAEHGITRKALAASSGVSERYLAQLESGQGNISILLLRKLSRAMSVPVESLVREDASSSPRRVALLGLRGAGKSTLGERLAAAMSVPFVELDREVEREAGVKLGEVFTMYGQEAFRRFERRALERVLRTHDNAVIAAGGSIVNDPDSYRLLLENCRTVWLKAKPEEHMNRVIAQGDMRPFEGKTRGKTPGRATALDEIRKLLSDRDGLYSRAGLTIDTSGRPVKAVLDELKGKLTS
ncbi:MAG TPA: helix-turn-helix transcriptional regulator [Burkholderiales bacterium]|jgi:XRE family aerobic/anaerobic benzoate catabolism transcriptional regulator|nr:helix-turn-helix transcriptional regulator [Burkholderiales bacterium]